MKNLFCSFIFVLFICFGISSCSTKQENGISSHDSFVSSLSSADTTEVINLCQEFFTKLATGDKESALSMLSLSTDSGDVLPMSEEKLKSLTKQFSLFPVLDQHLVDFKFGDAGDNLMRFKVVFAKDENGNEDAINFGLNPIRKDGKWYLTVRNATAKVAE